MVLELSTAFAMRCPVCGRLEVDQINIFQLSGNRKHTIYCECGSEKAIISRKGSSYLVMDYYCIICDYKHSIVIPKEKFWTKNHLNILGCLETDLSLGYYGPYKLIKEELESQQRDLASLADELGFDDFIDPELMLEVLDYLHDSAANSNLYCECGSHDINIELFSDKVELTCNNCQASLIIPAAYREDLVRLKMSDEIVLSFSPESTIHSKHPWI